MGYSSTNISTTNNLLRSSFLYMFVGLLITAAVPAYVLFTNNVGLLSAVQRFYLPLIIAEFAVVMVLSFAINKISVGMARILFFGYALLNGFVFSILTIAVPIQLLIYALAVTSIMFLVIAIYGYVTTEDLSQYSKILFGALIALVILSVINIFINAPAFYWMVSVFGVVLFSALIAFDVNRIKNMAYEIADGDEELVGKLGVMGALTLYLDFINLFVYVLRLFSGNKRD
ncbi:Bax inhibitor-1/YccA family protein [Cetobacterium sp. SF1]|uniref:Bax inhibitor-1/YccA family protein n=1 Tax=unclassified Cetobacterium TaxID=2630983 RepID=UPI003CF9534C